MEKMQRQHKEYIYSGSNKINLDNLRFSLSENKMAW